MFSFFRARHRRSQRPSTWIALPAIAAALTLAWPLPGAAQDSTLDKVLADKAMRVCIWPDYYGITYRNPKTQQLSGIDIDLAREFAKDLGVQTQFIDSSFAQLIDDVSQSRCDVAMFAIGITEARARQLQFTKPHLRSDIYAITTHFNRRIRDWADIDKPGVVVAVAKGTYHEPVMREKLKSATLVALDTPFAREQEVESGRADVFMTDFPYSQRMLATSDWARLVSPPSAYHLTSYAYAVRPGDDRWHARVEAFMRDIKRDGRLLAAARQHRLTPIVVVD
ncbi:ABC transporter substrate-binding protein [Janthinobacterium sp. 17J80-10]|uniref:ABC transporter substrate-binding protein n=1 Tax=Janthinobacterium sp. 17J80-10 TaxID=2497863 RepID=UPI001005897A|nr:ABC transporter substrate-binding protein [Janthinobacterium sp. 17J80-10]QAU35924.1 amino acid ABC transporter substrate-binding protein [Janthinobacterium sp. 17J80-10]